MARVYVGNLPTDIKESELDDLFYKYGRIRDIDIKNPARPPAFAFVTFDDIRDAEDAVRGRDGYNFDGNRLRCEFSKGSGGRSDDRDRDRRAGSGRTGGRRTDYGVVVTNLPRGCSWQDLKDFMRKHGDVVFTDVDRSGEGVVEFSNEKDMEHAVKDLDDTEFKAFSDSSYIRVKYANPPKKRDRSRSRTPERRGASRSRSRDRGGDRSRSADRNGDR